jgi:hypothetical protein
LSKLDTYARPNGYQPLKVNVAGRRTLQPLLNYLHWSWIASFLNREGAAVKRSFQLAEPEEWRVKRKGGRERGTEEIREERIEKRIEEKEKSRKRKRKGKMSSKERSRSRKRERGKEEGRRRVGRGRGRERGTEE